MSRLVKQPETTHFLLVPDSGAARRLRRALACERARTGVVVGFWSELIAMALDSHALQVPEKDWQGAAHAGMASLADAFWQASYQNSPEETVSEVAHDYTQLLEESEPLDPFRIFNGVEMEERGGSHLADLVRLHDELGGALPENLAVIQRFLGMEPSKALRRLQIYHVE